MKETEENVEEWKEVEEKWEDEEINYVEWEKENTTAQGKLVKLFESKDGSWFGKIDTGAEDKKLTMFSAPIVLRGKLNGHVGEEVRITYLGKVKFKSGKTGKDFKVYLRGATVPTPSPVNPQGGEKSTQGGQGPQAPPSGGKRDRAPEDASKSSVRETDRDEIGAFVN